MICFLFKRLRYTVEYTMPTFIGHKTFFFPPRYNIIVTHIITNCPVGCGKNTYQRTTDDM